MSDFDEIRNTIARNNHALDDRRYDDCVRTYAPDGVIAGRRGHAAIREFMNHQELATRPDLERRHVNTNIAITVAGDVAEAVSDLLIHDRVADGPWTLTAVGRYTDTLARQADGSWLFTERKLRFI
ncbi:hypothetical protein GCM10029964_011960 [Kibdelosporangium lantanae]